MAAPARSFVLASLLLAACTDATEVEPLGRPPVVLIVFDALHAGHVSHLGYERETTPELDALAADGVTFTQAFAPAPYTRASIPSLLTGRRPDAHGLTTKGDALHEDELTLAEMLRARGYHTVGAAANPNGGVRQGMDQGFEVFDEMFLAKSPEEIDVVHRSGLEMHLTRPEEFVGFTAEALASTPAEAPLFLYLHVLQPHSPYHPPPELRELWLDPDYDGHLASGATEQLMDCYEGKYQATPEDILAATALYDATLRDADRALGGIVEVLKQAGIYDEALIVVTSDHGEAFWQHGVWGHNLTLYDEALHVPLVVKPPASVGARGLRSEGLASIMDIAPTLAEWLDFSGGREPMHGLSLARRIVEPGWTGPERSLRLRSHHEVPHLALRTESHKTILERHQETGEVTGVEHFRLEDDPGERDDRAQRHAEEVTRTRRLLEDWIHAASSERVSRGRPLVERERRVLEMLGYTDSGD